MRKIVLYSRITCFIYFLLFQNTGLAYQEGRLRIGTWDNISGFAIHPSGDYIILVMESDSNAQLYESRLEMGRWSHPQPLDAINQYMGGNANIGGPSFYYNGNLLYYHANFQEGEGGYDIYYSIYSDDGWSAPVNIGPGINSDDDELYPAMAPGKQKLYFTRGNPEADVDKPRRTPDCQVLYVTYTDPFGEWEVPQPLHDAINMACEYGVSVAIDGKTLFFASVDQNNHREGYNIYFARELSRGAWVLPLLIEEIASEYTNISPQVVGGYLYYLELFEDRREKWGRIYQIRLPSDYYPLPTLSSSGKVIHMGTGKPIHTNIKVFNPTTLAVLGEYDNYNIMGTYNFPLLDHATYIVDLRSPGYSFASFQPDFRYREKYYGPEVVELFDHAELQVSAYDSEIFRPLKSTIYAEAFDGSNKRFQAEEIHPGLYSLSLPIGESYSVFAGSLGFFDSSFDLSLKGDVVFGRFFRDMPLVPVKIPVEIFVRDAETKEGIDDAEIIIANLFREENFVLAPEDLQKGYTLLELRDEDSYEFTVRGAQGYSFYYEVIRINQVRNKVYLDLDPLRTEVAIRLNNIHFATNSAELTSESFAELDRVVDLIFNQEWIVVEISAHTDDVGSDAYNLLLSERRAQSVVNYLLDNNVPPDRLVARGYGLRRPLVPNISDENRALNRRVEFTILEIGLEEPDEE